MYATATEVWYYMVCMHTANGGIPSLPLLTVLSTGVVLPWFPS